MDIKKLSADIKSRTGVGLVVQVFFAISVFTNLCMAYGFATMDKSVRTVLVPPEIKQAFWVDGHQLSPQYIEQVGSWLIGLMATNSPRSIDNNIDQILKHVHPTSYGDLSVRWTLAKDKIKKDQVSRVFYPNEVRINEATNSIAMIGSQDTWLVDKKQERPEPKAWVISFIYQDGKITVSQLRETDPLNPFAPPKDTSEQ